MKFFRKIFKSNKSEGKKCKQCFCCKKNTSDGEIRPSGNYLCINCIIYARGGLPKYADIQKNINIKMK